MNHFIYHIALPVLLSVSMVVSFNSCRTHKDFASDGGGATLVSIATFNMRCDVLEDDPGNNWLCRLPRIARYITSQNIDVVASQELVGNQDSSLLKALPQYDEVRAVDGVNAIFYRKSQVEVLSHGCFSLSEQPDSIGKKGWDAAYPRLALWAVMRMRSSGKQFVVLNTHLDHIGAINRREGAKLIVERLAAIAHGLPVAVTGDFNTDDRSEAYAELTSTILVDAYKVAKEKSGVAYTWHNYGRMPMKERSKIDFVMVSRGVTVSRCVIPRETQGAMLSDHNPLIATLDL